jgi:hypothetical protein
VIHRWNECRQQSFIPLPDKRNVSLGSIDGTLYRTLSQARVGPMLTLGRYDAIDEHQSKSHYLRQGT